VKLPDLKMADNSLFAVLLRSSWWISAAVAAGVVAVANMLLPEAYRIYGAAMGLPFMVIAGMSLWKQLQRPSTGRVDKTLDAVRTMTWPDFAALVEDGYRSSGYQVRRVQHAAADFEVTKDMRTLLVSGKRWKVARTGIEPLRDLIAAKDARDAHGCIYIAIGEVSDNARLFAAEKRIQLVGGEQLAQLLPNIHRAARAAA
jgi:restriction system protein